jgi:hypothetical protein
VNSVEVPKDTLGWQIPELEAAMLSISQQERDVDSDDASDHDADTASQF